MLTVEEYLDRVVALATPLPSEPCPVGSGFGRVLDEDVVAPTVSVGIAIAPDGNETLSSLMRRSDLAMYDAKGRGRNCVVVAPDRNAKQVA